MASPLKIRLVLLLGILVVFWGISGLGGQPAFGQEQTGDCSSDPPCKILAERAKQQSASGNLVEALRLYKLAYGVRADPTLLFNLARVLHKQGSTVEAASYYQKYLDSPVADEEQKPKARAYLEQVQQPPPEALVTPRQVADVPTQTAAEVSGAPGSLTATVVTSRDQIRPSRPLMKKWWFWAGLGGSVLAVSAITAGAVLGTSSTQPPQPSLPANSRVLPSNTAMFMF